MRKNGFVVNSRQFAVLCCLLGASMALNACGKDDDDAGEKCAETTCKDANILAVCDAQTGISSERECAYGCENNACKAAPAADKCDETKCKDANILAVCDAQTGISFERECAYGCENNACKAAADKCTETVCKDANILAVCDAETGIIKERECADGCENNACKPKTAEDKCQDGTASCSADGAYAEKCEQGALWREQCANGCENGACKKQTIHKSGEKCDRETFKAYCLDDLNMYAGCGSDGIYYNECNFDETCLTSQDGTQIGCYDKTEDICDNLGETVTSCKTFADDMIWGYQESDQCMLMSDGTGRLIETSYEHCNAGCAADGKNCAPETTEDGKSCSIAMQANCASLRRNCAVFSGVAGCYDSSESSDCAEAKSSCVGEDRIRYDDDYTPEEYTEYIATACIASDDGKAFIKRQETCAIGCTADGTKCKPHTADGKTCTTAAASWCQDHNYGFCAIYDGSVLCYDETDKCNAASAGEEIIACDDENNIAYYYRNRLADDGQTCVKMYDYKTTCAEGTACVGGKGCTPLKKDDGTCKDEAKKYCEDEGYAHCAFKNDSIYCYNNEDVCAELNSIRSRCEDDGNYELLRDICAYADDNKTLLYSTVGSGYCAYGCSASTNSCRTYRIDYESLDCNDSDKAACKTNSRDALCETVGGYGFCAHADDACNAAAEGTTKMRCAGASMTDDLLLTYVCAKTDSTTYAWTKVNHADQCDYGCSDGACLPEPTEESVCTEDQKSYCAGFGADSCIYVSSDWPQFEPICYNDADVCAGEDCPDSLSACEDNVERTYYSEKSADGAKTYYVVTNRNSTDCEFGCNADNTACLQMNDDYSDPCNADEFTERCDGNTVVYCDDGVVTTLSCDDAAGDGEAATCYLSSTANYADCYTESDVTANACTIPSTDMYCDDETYGHAAFLTYSCAEFKRSDGSKTANLYYMSSGEYCTNADETAYTVCNDDYSACSDVLEITE